MRIGHITVPLSSEHEFAKEAIVLNDTTLATLKTNLRGELIQRNEPGYEEARKLYNGMIDLVNFLMEEGEERIRATYV